MEGDDPLRVSTAYVPRRMFDAIFGVMMIAGSRFLFIRPISVRQSAERREGRYFNRTLVEADGTVHNFCYNPILGIGLSVLVGYLSSFLGVGGGFIHVPALVHLLTFPVHIATATSHFILAIMALAGTLAHVAAGTFSRDVRMMTFLAVGALGGAQAGAWFSDKIHGIWIIRGLAGALALVGLRLLLLQVW